MHTHQSGTKVTRLLQWLLSWLAAIVLLTGFVNPVQARASQGEEQSIYRIIRVDDLPREAQETLQKIKAGGPFQYRKDGIVFGNHEGFLPHKVHGYYTEYTVTTPGSHDRGARRIIAGAGRERNPSQSGEYYYTDDHYQTFKRIIER